MIPAIGFMIGACIIAHCIDMTRLSRKSIAPDIVMEITSVITILITVVSMVGLLNTTAAR